MQFFHNLLELFNEALPPDTSVLKIGIISIGETLMIALVGTLLGLVISLPLGLLASRNLFSRRIVSIVRLILAAIRTLPALLWAIVFVVLMGFGMGAGIAAMTMYTVGYLGKLQYESIEGVDPEPLNALKATGISKFKLIRYAVLPLASNNLISQMLFMFDYNVRASSILGFVGAGGIGFYIAGYLKFLEYDKVATMLLLVFITVVIIDVLSMKIRDRWLVK